MQPLIFWIASHRAEHIQLKEFSLVFGPFFMFSHGGKGGRGRKLEAEVQRNTETQREKLPIKTAQITGAPSETLAHKLADKREPSAKHIPVLF